MQCTCCNSRGLFHVEHTGSSRRLLCHRCTERELATIDPIAARFFKNWLPVQENLKTPAGSVQPACPTCNTTYAEFEQTGLLGCSHCYQSFAAAVMPALTILHSHEGLSG